MAITAGPVSDHHQCEERPAPPHPPPPCAVTSESVRARRGSSPERAGTAQSSEPASLGGEPAIPRTSKSSGEVLDHLDRKLAGIVLKAPVNLGQGSSGRPAIEESGIGLDSGSPLKDLIAELVIVRRGMSEFQQQCYVLPVLPRQVACTGTRPFEERTKDQPDSRTGHSDNGDRDPYIHISRFGSQCVICKEAPPRTRRRQHRPIARSTRAAPPSGIRNSSCRGRTAPCRPARAVRDRRAGLASSRSSGSPPGPAGWVLRAHPVPGQCRHRTSGSAAENSR